MIAKVQKWGNSQGIRVPRTILEQSQMSIGELIEISAKKGQIIIKPVSKIKGKYNLKTLIDQIPKGYKAHEIDWGISAGKEDW